jgi:chromate transporter
MTSDEARARDGSHPAVSFGDALRAYVLIALNSFGGPAAQIAIIHRVIVEERGRMSERRFVQATGYCMLLPGPEAQQLATYVGWTLHGIRGGLAAGGLFILPGFLSILALSVVYVLYGDVPAIEGIFFGLKAAVLAIVLHAVWRLRKRVLSGRTSVAIAVAAFLAMFVFGVPFPLVIVVAAATGAILQSRVVRVEPYAPGDNPLEFTSGPPSRLLAGWRLIRIAGIWLAIWLLPIAVLALVLGPDNVFVREATFFSRTAVVRCGGAYAVLSYVAQQAVEVYGWLTPTEMLDGLGMTETTPGPLIQVVQFVGFLGAYRSPGALHPVVAGLIGSVVTTWVTFAPCFLFIFAGAPLIEHLSRWRRVQAALNGILAAVVGVILNLAMWFGVHTLFGEVRPFGAGISLDVPVWSTLDRPALVLTVLSAIALFRYRVGLLSVVAGGALAGLIIHLAR